jgi:hypothetical protein
MLPIGRVFEQPYRLPNEVMMARISAAFSPADLISIILYQPAAATTEKSSLGLSEYQARNALKLLKGAFHAEFDSIDGVSVAALQELPASIVALLIVLWPKGELPLAHRIRELGLRIGKSFAATAANTNEVLA